MYNIMALKRKIAKEGLDSVIKTLLSEDLPLQLKQDLEREHIFCDGVLCLGLVYSLA